MNLFGVKKKQEQSGPSLLLKSIEQLRAALDTLDKREAHLHKQMALALSEAKKKSKAKDKRGALFHLKRKKMFEKQIDQIYGKKANIELQIMTLESASGNNDVLKAMKSGAEALKKSVKDTDVEKVADVMEDINESMGLADELGEALSQPIGPVMDEDELNAELEEMENELDEVELLKAPMVPSKKVGAKESKDKEKDKDKEKEKEEKEISSLPSVPSKPIVVKKEKEEKKEEPSHQKQEDNELRALEAEMGM